MVSGIQKIPHENGAVVRRTIGYRRFEGLEAAAALARLYAAMRLFVNFFQPSFKRKRSPVPTLRGLTMG